MGLIRLQTMVRVKTLRLKNLLSNFGGCKVNGSCTVLVATAVSHRGLGVISALEPPTRTETSNTLRFKPPDSGIRPWKVSRRYMTPLRYTISACRVQQNMIHIKIHSTLSNGGMRFDANRQRSQCSLVVGRNSGCFIASSVDRRQVDRPSNAFSKNIVMRVSCSSCTIISRQLTACGLELGDEKCDMSLESLSMTHPVCAYGNSITEIRMGRDIDRQVNCTIERCQSRDK